MGKNKKMNRWDGEENRFRDQRGQEGSQEDLNEYIRVTGPGTIVMIVSLLILLVALIIWGFVGTLPVTETVTGLVTDAAMNDVHDQIKMELPQYGKGDVRVLCFVDASRYNGQAVNDFDDKVNLKMPDQTTFSGTIETRFMEPLSGEAAKSLLFDNGWVLDKCINADYNWLLVIRPDEDISKYVLTLTDVKLVTEEVPPIRFLMK
jgi:hypothetical protein